MKAIFRHGILITLCIVMLFGCFFIISQTYAATDRELLESGTYVGTNKDQKVVYEFDYDGESILCVDLTKNHTYDYFDIYLIDAETDDTIAEQSCMAGKYGYLVGDNGYAANKGFIDGENDGYVKLTGGKHYKVAIRNSDYYTNKTKATYNIYNYHSYSKVVDIPASVTFGTGVISEDDTQIFVKRPLPKDGLPMVKSWKVDKPSIMKLDYYREHYWVYGDVQRAGKCEVTAESIEGVLSTGKVTIPYEILRRTKKMKVGKKWIIKEVEGNYYSILGIDTIKSSNNAVAKVAKKAYGEYYSEGFVKSVGPGKCTITTMSNHLIINKFTLYVKGRLNKRSMTIRRGKKRKLKLIGCRKKLKWKSSNKRVAIVSKGGVVKGKRRGRASIYVKYGGIMYKCKVRVI